MQDESRPSQSPSTPQPTPARRPVALAIWLAVLLILIGVAAVVVWNAMQDSRPPQPVSITAPPDSQPPPATPVPPATRAPRTPLATPPSPVPPPRWTPPATQPATLPAYSHGMRRISVTELVFLTARTGRLNISTTAAGRRARVLTRMECLDSYALEVVRMKASSDEAWQDRLHLDEQQAATLKNVGPLSGSFTDKAASSQTLAAYDAWAESSTDGRQAAWEALLEQIDRDVQPDVKAAQDSYQSKRADLVRAVGEDVARRMEAAADSQFAPGRGWPRELLSRSCDLTAWAGNINIASRRDLAGKTTHTIQPMFRPKPDDKNLYDCLMSISTYSNRRPAIPDLSDDQLAKLRDAIREAGKTPPEPLADAERQKLEAICEKFINDPTDRLKTGEELVDAMTAAAPSWDPVWQSRARRVIDTVTPVLTDTQVQYLRTKTPQDLFPPPTRPATK